MESINSNKQRHTIRAKKLFQIAVLVICIFASISTKSSEISSRCAPDIPSFMVNEDDDTAINLALSVSESLYPPKAIFERIFKDITSLYEKYPELRQFVYRGQYDTKSILVTVTTPDIAQLFLAQGSADWNCVSTKLSVQSTRTITPTLIQVRFSHPLNPNLATKVYAKLQGVVDAHPNPLVGSGNSICVKPSNPAWEYIVREGRGDCPSGCTQFTYRYFRSPEAGDIQPMDLPSISPQDERESHPQGSNCR